MSDKHELNANRIFVWLFLFTGLEVGLSFIVEKGWVSMPKPIYWGGLITFAFLKGLLIAKEFMHLKFEGWIVRGLILPTPLLMLVIYFVLTGDISYDKYEEGRLNNPIGAMVNKDTGEVWKEIPRRVHGMLMEGEHAEAGEHAGSPQSGEAAEHGEPAQHGESGSH